MSGGVTSRSLLVLGASSLVGRFLPPCVPERGLDVVALSRTTREGPGWVRAEGAGTNTGSFAGPPTGLPVRLTVIDIARIADGRIVEHWGIPDRFELLVRLGRMPTRD